MAPPGLEIAYWRDGDDEIDYLVLRDLAPILALEVKSGRKKRPPTDAALKRAGLDCPRGLINQDSLEKFLLTDSLESAVAAAVDHAS